MIRDLPPYAFTPEAVMTVLSWIRLTVSLWLLRKAVKAAGWLLLALLAVVAVAGHGRDGGRVRRGVAARLAAGPAAPRRRRVPARDRRLAGRGSGRASTAGGPPRWPRPVTGRTAGTTGRARRGADVPAGWPRSRSRPGWRWPPGCGPGGTTRSAPGSAAGWPPRRSPSTPASGDGRSAPPPAAPPRPAPSRC